MHTYKLTQTPTQNKNFSIHFCYYLTIAWSDKFINNVTNLYSLKETEGVGGGAGKDKFQKVE